MTLWSLMLLEKEHINVIIDIELDKISGENKRLRLSRLSYLKKLKDFIADKGFDQQYGARPLKRAIQKYIEDALAEEIITSKIHEGDVINMDIEKDATELNIKIKKAEKPAES